MWKILDFYDNNLKDMNPVPRKKQNFKAAAIDFQSNICIQSLTKESLATGARLMKN